MQTKQVTDRSRSKPNSCCDFFARETNVLAEAGTARLSQTFSRSSRLSTGLHSEAHDYSSTSMMDELLRVIVEGIPGQRKGRTTGTLAAT
jgi:hypothetical protein